MPDQAPDPADAIAGRVSDLTPAQHAQRSSRLDDVVSAFQYKDTAKVHEAWLQNPVTQVYLSALRELSYLPYARGVLPTDGNVSAQYGMTLAFQFAERLLRDPGSVLPVFTVEAPGKEPAKAPDPGYSDAPDSAF